MNNLWVFPRVTILSLKRRVDRRHAAVSSIMWFDIDLRHVNFFDAIDAQDYNAADDLIHDAVADGFPAFESMCGYSSSFETQEERNIGFAPLAYAWSLCRYFRELSDRTTYELFLHDDMYGRAHPHFHINNDFLRNIYNDPICMHQCNAKDIRFVCLLLNTKTQGHEPTQHGIYEEIVLGTDVMNFKAGYYSPYGASVLLERLTNQIALGSKTSAQFLASLASTESLDQLGIFSTAEPLFVEYPVEFLGSDIRNIPRLQGNFSNLFSDIKPSAG